MFIFVFKFKIFEIIVMQAHGNELKRIKKLMVKSKSPTLVPPPQADLTYQHLLSFSLIL